MMVNNKRDLLLIAFDQVLAQQCIEDLRPFIDIDWLNSMDDLEHSIINDTVVIYLMDLTSSDHLYNIHYIRNRYPAQPFFVLSSTVSIPLLHHSLHIGVDDLFLYPFSEQDKEALLIALKGQTCIDCFSEAIKNSNGFDCSQLTKEHPISSLLDIVERDYIKGPSLQDLADNIHLSPSRICHLFKELSGMTYSHYLLCRKIEEGERLLAAGQHSITSIAYQIGFANPSHFCRTFKEHFNITPTAYLNGNREIEHNVTYLQYQRLRYEVFSSMANAAEENEIIPAEQSQVS